MYFDVQCISLSSILFPPITGSKSKNMYYFGGKELDITASVVL
jgi:hypothetical protein